MKKTKKKGSPSKKDVVRTSKVHPDSTGSCGAAVDGMSTDTCKVNIGAHINIGGSVRGSVGASVGASVGVAPGKHTGASSNVGEKEGKVDEEEDADDDDDEDEDGEDDDKEDDKEDDEEDDEEGGEEEDNPGKDLRVKSTKNSSKIAGLTNIDVSR